MLLKTLFVFVGLCLPLIGFAAKYTVEGAGEAAGSLMPKEGADAFIIYNMPSAKGKPKDLLKIIRAAGDRTVYLAITSPKIEYIRDFLRSTMSLAKGERFNGLYLVVIADRADVPLFEEILKDRGVTVKCGVY